MEAAEAEEAAEADPDMPELEPVSELDSVDLGAVFRLLSTLPPAHVLEWEAPTSMFSLRSMRSQSPSVVSAFAARTQAQTRFERSEATEPLVLPTTEVENGWRLLDVSLDYRSFQLVKEAWEQNVCDPNFFAFAARLYDGPDQLCTDWRKITPEGEVFGGYWDEKDKANAGDLTWKKNVLELYKLPFPDSALRAALKLACDNRNESVRIIHALCVWVQRKQAQLRADRSGLAPVELQLTDGLHPELAALVWSYVPLPAKVPCFPPGWSEAQFLALSREQLEILFEDPTHAATWSPDDEGSTR